MRASVDSDGRVAIPAEVRAAAGLEPGAEVEVRVRNGVVELAPVELSVRLERRGYLLVAVPEIAVEAMTTDEVEAVREQLLADRTGPT